MAKTIDVKVPDIGDFESVEVIEVLVSVGDQVAIEDSLITLESDKATMEIPSPAAGAVMDLKVSVGDAVSEGDVILVIGADAAAVADPAEEEPEPTKSLIPAKYDSAASSKLTFTVAESGDNQFDIVLKDD